MSTYGSALFEHHQKKLADSAVPAEVARERGYVSADTKAQLERYGFGVNQRRVPALIIPLHGVTGEIVGHQIRPDQPRSLGGKPAKYETKIGQRMLLDVPPRCRNMLTDPSVPLIVTEGPIKADALAAVGFCAVALLGVWSWRGTNDDGGKTALPDWEYVALNGRQVYIGFDSDVMLNPHVHEAMRRLAGLLEHRGAQVAYVYFPCGEHGTKVGADDYLGAGHTAAQLLGLAVSELRKPATDATDATGSQGKKAEPVGWGVLGGLLDSVEATLSRYVAFPEEHHQVATALWVGHAHCVDAAESTPRLAALSPEPGSGKTRVLEVLELLTPGALHAVNISPAAMFRIIDKARPTLLLDEADSYLGPQTAKNHEDIRALVNAGHRRGAVIPRCVGETHDVQNFPAYAAVALAGLGDLPETILNRSIILPMRRRRHDEHIEPFRARDATPPAHALRDQLAGWAATNIAQLREQRPTMPPGITDRPADVWEPLLAIADAAGGDWPDRSRAACTAIVTASADRAISLGVRLLADTRIVFDNDDRETIPTKDLLRLLCDLEESPWSDLRGGPLTARYASKLLKAYGITPGLIRSPEVVRGYRKADFRDAWERYLHPPTTPPATSPTEPVASVACVTAQVIAPAAPTLGPPAPATSAAPTSADDYDQHLDRSAGTT